MSARAKATGVRAIEASLRRVRLRAALAGGLRDLAFGVTGAALAFATAAWAVGPTSSRAVSALVALCTAAPLLGALAHTLRAARRLRGPAAAALLARVDRGLASRARSALELVGAAGQGSPALVAAHVEGIERSMAGLDPARVVPWGASLSPRALLPAAVLAIAGAMVGSSDRARMGAYALVHPGAAVRGTHTALVVDHFEARVEPPAYRGKAPTTTRDRAVVEADAGSRVRVRVSLRVDAVEAALDLPTGEVRLRSRGGRVFEGELVARQGGALRVRVRTDEGWLADAAPRSLRVVADTAPTVAYVVPGAGRPVAVDAELPFQYRAEDDVGLGPVVQVVRVPSGVELRTTLVSPEAATRHVTGEGRLRLADFHLRRGDSIATWVEASDADAVDGAKTTRSASVTIVVESDADARQAAAEGLRRALELALGALADRLEKPVPERSEELEARHRAVTPSTASLLLALAEVASENGAEGGPAATDRALVRAFEQRLRGLSRTDDRDATRNVRAATAADAKVVEALEDGTLALADVLARVQLDDAAAIAREIAALEEEIRSLVETLRTDDRPETRQALAAAIARVRARMGELEARLAAMGDEVPAEFRNGGGAAGSPAASRDALASLERAIAEGDFDAAERSMRELDRDVRDLAQAFGGSASEFSERTFGPRERAFAEAFEALSGLEIEQRTLADQTGRVRRGVTDRALDAQGDATLEAAERLADAANRVRQRIAELGRMRTAPIDRDAIERAEQRLRDVQAALHQGDVGEADAMSQAAASAMESVARDLELSALMFPGQEGRTAEAARSARAAADALHELGGDILRTIPRLREHLSQGERGAMAEGANRQRQVAEAAQRLADRFEAPAGGASLSQEIGQGLREAADAMAHAEDSLRGQDPIDAEASQARAARMLRDLRESVERDRSGGSGGGGGGQGGDGESFAGSPTERVEIPGRTSSAEAAARRRRILDAMGDDVPAAYRGAVQRYYEELLR